MNDDRVIDVVSFDTPPPAFDDEARYTICELPATVGFKKASPYQEFLVLLLMSFVSGIGFLLMIAHVIRGHTVSAVVSTIIWLLLGMLSLSGASSITEKK